MYIRVHALADAKRESLTRDAKDLYTISVKEPAERNLANTRIRELVAQDLGVPVAATRIISGHHSPHKILTVHMTSGTGV